MRAHKRVKVGSLFMAGVVLLMLSGQAGAQSLSIGGTPAYPRADNPRSTNIFIHEIKPGEAAKDGIRIINPTKDERTINLGAVDSIAASDGSFSCKQNNEKKTGVGSWIRLDKKQVNLAASKDEVVGFTIRVPANAGPGEHSGCITFQDTKSYAKTSGAGIQLGFRGAVRLAVTVPGDIKKKLTILRVETKRNDDGSYMVSPVAKNSGNVSLDVQARAQLESAFGQKTRLLYNAKYPIMPGSTMGWPYRFERPFWGGFYKAYTSLSYNADPNAGIGEHMSDTKRTSRVSDYFFMVPAPQAIAIELAIVLLPVVGLFLWLRRHRQAKTIQKKWVAYTVQSGDTIVSIAREHSINWKKLARRNKIRPPYALEGGSSLFVPAGKGKPKLRESAVVAANTAESQPAASTQAADAVTQPSSPAPAQQRPALEWEAPRSAPAAVRAEHRSAPMTQFPEFYQSHQPTTYEVPSRGDSWTVPGSEQTHGIIDDPDLVSQLRSVWGETEQNDVLVSSPAKKIKPKASKKAKPAKKPRAKKDL